MNTDNLNKSLAILGNIGVIAGIVFLGLEIRQNSAMTQAQTRDSMTEKQMAFYELTLSDPNLSDTWRKIFIEDWHGDLETLEGFQTEVIMRSQVRMWENEWYQYTQGLFQEDEFGPRLELWRNFMAREVYQDIWDRRLRISHSPDFVELIESLIEESGSN